MQEVFKKIIEKLEEKEIEAILKAPNTSDINNPDYQKWMMKSFGFKESMKIVQKVAAEYNNGWIPADKPPKDNNYVLLSFENFSLPLVGRYEADGKDEGAYYVGDCDEEDTCIANDLFVDAWQPLPPRYNPDGEKHEKKTKYDQIRSMCVDEMASFLSEVKYDGIYYNEGMEYPIISEVWKEWLQSEAESEKND